MMSNPPSSLQRRQGLHRRQNSTPIAFEAMKVQMPPTNIQRQNVHRRGQSYEVSRSPIRRHQHTGSAVSMNTNIGPIQGQQILREAQQQRIARPGQQQRNPQLDTAVAQQCAMFAQPQSLPGTPYNMATNGYMPIPQDMMHHSQFQNIRMPIAAGPQNAYMLDENSQYYFQAMHQMQEVAQMMPATDRRMSQPELRVQTGMRPYTPTHQIQTAHFPLTPVTTPMQQQQMQYAKSLQSSPRWRPQDENIVSPRPISMQKSRSLQGIAEHQEVQQFADVFDAPELSSTQAPASATEPVKQKKPGHSKNNSMNSVKHQARSLFGEISEGTPGLEELPQPALSSSQPPSSPVRPALSPRRMSISDLNLDPGISASIEETNISLDDIAQFIEGPDSADQKWTCKYEDCNKRFGRKENIKSHVQTHLGDRQFRCDHCKKCFVRGHDLKRHAKIHTGSKAYACLCGNAFARHDALTRHRQRGMCIGAFEGIVRKEIKRGRPKKQRPEMDERLDKASRTRKNKDKTQTNSQGDMYASSASSCSMSSWGSPLTQPMDNLSIHGGNLNSPAASYDELFGFSAQGMTMTTQDQLESISHVALPADMFSFTPPASPDYSTGNKPSPSHCELTSADLIPLPEEQQSIPQITSPMHDYDLISPQISSQSSNIMLDESSTSNQASLPPSSVSFQDFATNNLPSTQQTTIQATTQATSLPSLSHSSSPPPQEAGSTLVFDFPDDAAALRMSTMSNISNLSFGLSGINKVETHTQVNITGGEQPRNEFDSFLDYNDDSQLGMGMGMSMNMGMDSGDGFFAGMN